jgi:hypothetical protein
MVGSDHDYDWWKGDLRAIEELEAENARLRAEVERLRKLEQAFMDGSLKGV